MLLPAVAAKPATIEAAIAVEFPDNDKLCKIVRGDFESGDMSNVLKIFKKSAERNEIEQICDRIADLLHEYQIGKWKEQTDYELFKMNMQRTLRVVKIEDGVNKIIEDFKKLVADTAGLNEKQAVKLYSEYKASGAIKIDAVAGTYQFTNDLYKDPSAMRRAIGLEKVEKEYPVSTKQGNNYVYDVDGFGRRYSATLCKYKNGELIGDKQNIGLFESYEEAKLACQNHYKKALAAAKRFSNPLPIINMKDAIFRDMK